MKINTLEVSGIIPALHGMRNPMNSWAKNDSEIVDGAAVIGPNDMDLASRLIKAGPEHCKFLRQISVVADVTAPLYW